MISFTYLEMISFFLSCFLFTDCTKVILIKFQYCLVLVLTVFMQFPTIPCKTVLATNKYTLFH